MSVETELLPSEIETDKNLQNDRIEPVSNEVMTNII